MARAQIFELRTQDAGLENVALLNGAAVADYDLDGDLDIYFVSYLEHNQDLEHTWNRLYRNNGDGTFSDATEGSGLAARTVQGYARRSLGNKFGAAWGDYDNDGDPDLLLTNVGSELLYQNMGDGTFLDVTDASGVGGPADVTDIYESSSAVWWDYDNDGDLDLHISSWVGFNRMYENNGNDTFTDVSLLSGLADDSRTWSAAPIDINHDGFLDLYLVNDFGPNTLYVSNGDKTFSDETDARGVGNSGHGMGVTVEDYNNDGYFDIYVTNIFASGFEWNPLYTNDGSGHFTDDSVVLKVDDADWAWGTEWFDFDQDGDLDLYVANGFILQNAFDNRLFRNELAETGSVEYTNVSTASGTNGTAEARAMVTFDFDQDGDLDVLVANFNRSPLVNSIDSWPYLYENVSDTQNWIQIELEGTVSNRDGFGASIRIEIAGKSYYRHNDGIGFLSQSIRPVHFGVGSADMIDEIQIFWPLGSVESFYNIPSNQVVVFVEGQGTFTHTVDPDHVPPSTGVNIQTLFPNPMFSSVTLEFQMSAPSTVILEVVNVIGQRVHFESLGIKTRGFHRTILDLNDRPGGVYFVRLQTPDLGQSIRSTPVVKIK